MSHRWPRLLQSTHTQRAAHFQIFHNRQRVLDLPGFGPGQICCHSNSRSNRDSVGVWSGNLRPIPRRQVPLWTRLICETVLWNVSKHKHYMTSVVILNYCQECKHYRVAVFLVAPLGALTFLFKLVIELVKYNGQFSPFIVYTKSFNDICFVQYNQDKSTHK